MLNAIRAVKHPDAVTGVLDRVDASGHDGSQGGRARRGSRVRPRDRLRRRRQGEAPPPGREALHEKPGGAALAHLPPSSPRTSSAAVLFAETATRLPDKKLDAEAVTMISARPTTKRRADTCERADGRRQGSRGPAGVGRGSARPTTRSSTEIRALRAPRRRWLPASSRSARSRRRRRQVGRRAGDASKKAFAVDAEGRAGQGPPRPSCTSRGRTAKAAGPAVRNRGPGARAGDRSETLDRGEDRGGRRRAPR